MKFEMLDYGKIEKRVRNFSHNLSLFVSPVINFLVWELNFFYDNIFWSQFSS